ncbi:MAG: hypothetical protein ACJ759_23500, partial [Thermoanaerobaculia bacterium]
MDTISNYLAARLATSSGSKHCRRVFEMPFDFRKFAAAIFLLALSCCSCYERRGDNFKGLSEARAKGAIE